jgi:hypothetical protein
MAWPNHSQLTPNDRLAPELVDGGTGVSVGVPRHDVAQLWRGRVGGQGRAFCLRFAHP